MPALSWGVGLGEMGLVVAGGAVGAGARYLVAMAALRLFGPGFPWGTLAVNLLGGFAMGVLAGILALRAAGGHGAQLFWGVGLLGGFTTFSSFSLELMVMLERGAWGLALIYGLGSVILATGALFCGLAVTRLWA